MLCLFKFNCAGYIHSIYKVRRMRYCLVVVSWLPRIALVVFSYRAQYAIIKHGAKLLLFLQTVVQIFKKNV